MKSQEKENQCPYCGQFVCVCDEEYFRDNSNYEDYYPYNSELNEDMEPPIEIYDNEDFNQQDKE